MHPFIKSAAIAMVVILIAACAQTGPAKKSARGVGHREPVPVSAAQRSDFNRALDFMKKQDYEKALQILEAITKENDSLPGVNVNLAISYMKLAGEDGKEQYEKAEAALLRAIDINSKNETAQFQLGLLYRRTGRFDASREAYERALKLNRDYALAHYNLGILCDIYLKQPKCAVEHFEKYRELVPDSSDKVSMWLTDIRRRAGMPEPKPPETAADTEG